MDAPSTAPMLAASLCLSRCRLDSHICEAVAVSQLCSCSCQSALVPVNQHLLSINILHLAKLLSTHSIPKVVSMAQPNESTMKCAIRVVGECYSIHRLDPSVGSSDHFYFQNLLESSSINFHNHSSSSTLTRRIVLVLFRIWKIK